MELIIILILILFNGFFSLSEIAVISSKASRLEKKKQEGSKGATIAIRLRENSDSFLSSVQVGITLVGLITGAYGGISLADNLTPLIARIPYLQPYASAISLIVIMFLTTYVTIVIGELVPKTIALSKPESVAIKVAPAINIFSKIFYPFVKLLSYSTNLVTGIMGIKEPDDKLTEYELKQMMKTASLEGVIEENQNIIHEKVFNFSDKRAKHLMTHRIEVEWIDLDENKEEIKKDIEKATHSKIVCCHETLDNFVGILSLRDYYKYSSEGENPNIEELMKTPVVIHEKTPATTVLENLRQNASHFCVVVDEYGDFEGIVTFHDIMENLIGLIPDEGEVQEPDYYVREDNSILINGDAPIEVLTNIIQDFDVDFEQIDYATVAGFVIEQINEIPNVGDKFKYNNYEFEIMDMDGNRIDKLLITNMSI